MNMKKMSMKELDEQYRALWTLIFESRNAGRADIVDFYRIRDEIKSRQEAEADERSRT